MAANGSEKAFCV